MNKQKKGQNLNKPREWGKIVVTTRLEKQVENKFFVAWSHLITKGLRNGLNEKHAALQHIRDTLYQFHEHVENGEGAGEPVDLRELMLKADEALQTKTDSFAIVKDRVAHMAANELARMICQREDFDSILFIDSDADFSPEILEELRNLEEGKQYDILQAFYVRRGWPPEAIWYHKDEFDNIRQCVVFDDNHTTEVAMVGLHFTLMRREVFEAMVEANPEIPLNELDFFFYPRNQHMSEDAAFSLEAAKLGFKMGATTVVKTGHISSVSTGWQSYIESLEMSGARKHWDDYLEVVKLVAEFTGEDPETVNAKAGRGSENVREALEKYNPQTAEEWREFYGKPDNGYLYDLLAWNFSPMYQKTIASLTHNGHTVLVVGGGLGGEVEKLKNIDGNYITAFELPGVLYDFLNFRYGQDGNVRVNKSDHLSDWADGKNIYDLIVAIDTIEHFHPDDFEPTMDAMFSMLAPDGEFYFRNNFGQQDLYPMHFDHQQAYDEWLEKNNLEIYRTVPEVEGQFIRRKS